MKKNTEKKIAIVEIGVRANRLTYFAQRQDILKNAGFRTFPTFHRMTKAQEKDYCKFSEKLDKEKIEQYICRPDYIYHIQFKEDYDCNCSYSCGEVVWRRGRAQ